MVEKLFTEDDYRKALKRFLEICQAEDGSPDAEELFKLIELLEVYEQENCS